MSSSLEKITGPLVKILLICLVFVQPYANSVDPMVVAMAILFFLLSFPAFVSLVLTKRPMLEVLVFLPILAISVAVGALNGHIPGDIVRGIIPYTIYIVTFGAIVAMKPVSRLELLRWYVIIAALISLKTLVILALNGVSLSDITRGVRATYFDINSGLPIATLAIPFVFVCFSNRWIQAALLVVLTTQILLGQSKALILITAVYYLVFLTVYTPPFKQLGSRAASLLLKVLIIISVGTVTLATFSSNPLAQRFITAVTDPKTELSGRVFEMGNSIRAIEETPLLGRGQGYVFIHKAATSTDENPVYEERRYTHSVVFYHLALMGLLGMPFALLMLYGPLLYLSAAQVNRLIGPPESIKLPVSQFSNYYVPTILAATGMLLFNLVSASYKNPQSLIILALINAVIFCLLSAAKNSQTE